MNAGVTGGTGVMFGIQQSSSDVASNHHHHCVTRGYSNVLGVDEMSWALNSKGYVYHNGKCEKYCDAFDDGGEHRVACLVNGYVEGGEMHFFLDGKHLGVAFREIFRKNENEEGDLLLCPVVASTVSQSIFRIEEAWESYATLQQMCALKVRDNDKCRVLARSEYKLPESMLTTAEFIYL